MLDLTCDQGLLVVTGATGWFGRTALHELQRLLSPDTFSRRVRAFASRPRTMASTGFSDGIERVIDVAPLLELPELAVGEPIAALLHTAFLTREYVERIGVEAYITTNRGITDLVCRSLELSPTARAAVISSGAAAALDAVSCHEEHLHADPYGVLKWEEERRLGKIVHTLVLRAYAVSGRFMRDPEHFALGDFLLRAWRGLPIEIRATMPVIRGYGHAGDICALAWKWLFSDAQLPSAPVAAVSEVIDLLALADLIAGLYHLPAPIAEINPAQTPNRYAADPGDFLRLLASYGINPSSMQDQIRETLLGLQGCLQMHDIPKE